MSTSTTTPPLLPDSVISITPAVPDFEIGEVSQQAMDAAANFLTTGKNSFARAANFAGISKTGKKSEKFGGACHYDIQAMNDRYLVATENGATRRGIDLNLVKAYLEWLLYHSQYREFIVNRTDFDFCLNHGFIVSGKAPYKLLQNLMIMTRHFYEVGESGFKLFNDYVLNRGIDPLVAYSSVFNSGLGYNPDAYNPYGDSGSDANPYTGNKGHRVQRCYNLDELERIVKGELLWNPGEPYTEKASIYGGSILWCKTSDGKEPPEVRHVSPAPEPGFDEMRTTDTEFDKAIRVHRGESVEKVKIYHPPNPFTPPSALASSKVEKERFTNKEAREFAIPWLDAQLKKRIKDGS